MPYLLSKSRSKIFMFCFKTNFYVTIIRITILKFHFISTYFFVVHINIYNYYFHINNHQTLQIRQIVRSLGCHYWTKKMHLFVTSLSLCSLVRSTFFPVVTRFSTSETKPWPSLLFSTFLLEVSLVIVELMLDIGLVIMLEETKSIGTKTLGVVRYFVTCIDLPKRKNRIIV